MKDDDYKVLGVDFKEKIDNDSKILLKKNNIGDYVYMDQHIIVRLRYLWIFLFVIAFIFLIPIIVDGEFYIITLPLANALFISIFVLFSFTMFFSFLYLCFIQKSDISLDSFIIVKDKIIKVHKRKNKKYNLYEFEELSKVFEYPILLKSDIDVDIKSNSDYYIFLFKNMRLYSKHNLKFYKGITILNSDNYELDHDLDDLVANVEDIKKNKIDK